MSIRNRPTWFGALGVAVLAVVLSGGDRVAAQDQTPAASTDSTPRLAGWLFTPTLIYSGGWDDNVLLHGQGDATTGDFLTVVNPRGVETQLEGGMIYGLSAALFGEITIKDGRVEQGNFDTYPVVHLKEAPKTEVHLALTGGKKWGGIGEPGAAIIPAAVTNAIFAVTGKRIRSLPIKGQSLSGAA